MKKLSLEPKASFHYYVKCILYQIDYESLPGSTDNLMLIIISQEILKAIRTFGPITNLPPSSFPKITRITAYELWQCQTVYGDLQAHCRTWNTLPQHMKRERRLRKACKGLHNKKGKTPRTAVFMASWGDQWWDPGVKGKLLPLEECYQLYWIHWINIISQVNLQIWMSYCFVLPDSESEQHRHPAFTFTP